MKFQENTNLQRTKVIQCPNSPLDTISGSNSPSMEDWLTLTFQRNTG